MKYIIMLLIGLSAATLYAAKLRISINVLSDAGATLQTQTIDVTNTNDMARLTAAYGGSAATLKSEMVQWIRDHVIAYERGKLREQAMRQVSEGESQLQAIGAD